MSSKLTPSLDTDDALNPKVNAAALDFLLIELIPLAQRITEQVQARDKAIMEEYRRSKIFTQQRSNASERSQTAGDRATQSTENLTKDATSTDAKLTPLGFPTVSPESREGIFHRLDSLGYRIGQGLVER